MSLLTADRALLEAFRRGEREALSRVYDEYAPAVAAFLARGFTFKSRGRPLQFRGFHQPFDLDNALAETFVRAFSERARTAYDGLTPFRGYLMAIARNLVLSELRRKEVTMSQLVCGPDGQAVDALFDAQDAALDADTPEGALPAATPNAEVQLLHGELTRLYTEFVAQLEGVEQAFFVARFEQQLTQLGAAEVVQLSHMQVRTLEKKLRRRFLEFMHTHGYLEAYAGASVSSARAG